MVACFDIRPGVLDLTWNVLRQSPRDSEEIFVFRTNELFSSSFYGSLLMCLLWLMFCSFTNFTYFGFIIVLAADAYDISPWILSTS